MGEEEIEGLFQYAKYQFDCGKYEISAELLGQYRLLSEDQGKLRARVVGEIGLGLFVTKLGTRDGGFNALERGH